MWRSACLLLAFSFFCTVSMARADEARQAFDSLYSAKIKQAVATNDRADDVALAKELLASAKASANTPGLLALMCEASYDLAQRHSEGHATAAEAMTLLAQTVVAKRDAAREKLIDVLTKQSRAGKVEDRDAAGEKLIETLVMIGDENIEAKKWGDAVGDFRRAVAIAGPKKSPQLDVAKAKLDLAMRLDRANKQIAQLREKLLADANDTAAAREIVRLYVVELDAPAEAAKFLDHAKDTKLAKLVPLAAMPIEGASEQDSQALGEWYLELAASAVSQSREVMWPRAAAYLARYLSLRPANDIARTKAELQIKQAEQALAAIDAERAPNNLKRSAPESWISKDATYKLSTIAGNYPPLPDLLTGGKNLHVGEFAFTTLEGVPGREYVIIDLGKPMVVSRIWIENRRKTYQDRARDLNLFLSSDPKEKGKAVWTAEKVENEWTIKPPQNMKVRYITIKQGEKNAQYLHLAQVKVFGWEK